MTLAAEGRMAGNGKCTAHPAYGTGQAQRTMGNHASGGDALCLFFFFRVFEAVDGS